MHGEYRDAGEMKEGGPGLRPGASGLRPDANPHAVERYEAASLGLWAAS